MYELCWLSKDFWRCSDNPLLSNFSFSCLISPFLYLFLRYEVYWLSKDLWRCSVEKTFLTCGKYDDLLPSCLLCLLSFLGRQRIKKRRYFPPCLLSLFSWRASCPCYSSKTWILNSFSLEQKGHKCSPGRPPSWMKRFLILIGYQVCRRRVFTRLEVSRGEWTDPKLSATKVHLNIFQSKQSKLHFCYSSK